MGNINMLKINFHNIISLYKGRLPTESVQNIRAQVGRRIIFVYSEQLEVVLYIDIVYRLMCRYTTPELRATSDIHYKSAKHSSV